MPINHKLIVQLTQDTKNSIFKQPKDYSIWSKLSGKCKTESKKSKTGFEVFFPTINPNGIHKKIALVIGGSKGVGLTCVKQLLENGAKAVMIADNDEKHGKKLMQKFSEDYGPSKTSFIKTNVENTVLLRHAYCSTINYWKGLDIVVNDHRHCDAEDWEYQIDRTIKGMVRNTLLALEYMGTHNGGDGGVVVNIVSKSNMNMSNNGLPLYIGAQHFIVGFDRSLAMQYYKLTGVKVLSLCPEDTKKKGCPPKYDLVKLLSKANCGAVW